MNMELPHEERSGEKKDKRKTYEQPRVLFKEKLEVMAAICNPGKSYPGDPQSFDCNFTIGS